MYYILYDRYITIWKIVYHWTYLFKLDSNLNEKLKINTFILYEKLI